MKKLVFIILSLFVLNTLQAQKKQGNGKVKSNKVEEKGKMVLGIHAGLSLTGLLYEVDKDSDTIKYIANSKPAFQISFDKFISNKVSIGFFTSLQSFKVDISYWDYDTINPKRIENLQAKMKRIYVGGRFLYHYKNTEKVDIYSGVRAGLLFWNNRLPSTDPIFVTDFEREFPKLNRPSIGLIPIGFRIKISPQISANAELGVFAPHILSFGVSYTF